MYWRGLQVAVAVVGLAAVAVIMFGLVRTRWWEVIVGGILLLVVIAVQLFAARRKRAETPDRDT
jgi:inner membrane protein involved in colicin E2 resistance